MGLLRLFLALVVVAEHTDPVEWLPHVSGRTAVEIFFVISGFYMAMVLETKYLQLPKGRRWITFIGARVSRLFPIYLVVLLGTITLLFLGGNTHIEGRGSSFPSVLEHPIWVWVPIAISNVVLIGQDWALFLGITPAGFTFTSDFRAAADPAYRYFLVPQAWTVALELTFYFLAPWLARRSTRTLLILGGTSLLIRFVLGAFFGLTQDPWTYRFFPSELVFFLAGMLAYRFRHELCARQVRYYFPLVLVVGGLLLFPALSRWGALYNAAGVVVPLAVSFAVPSIFAASKRNRADRWMGELSYPIYMVHVLVLGIIASLGVHPGGLINIVASVIAAVALVYMVDQPLERLRQRLLNRRFERAGVHPSGTPAGVGPRVATSTDVPKPAQLE